MSSFLNRLSDKFSMNSSMKLLTEILASKYELHAKYEPIELRRILNDKQGRQLFLRELSLPSLPLNTKSQSLKETHRNNALVRALKRISIFHHVVVYYHEFAELIEEIEMDRLIENIESCWFLDNVIKPYLCFLKRYCLGIEVYQKLRSMPYGSKDTIFQCMCYAINLLKSLFTVVSKLSNIGRYYREKFPKIIDYFVQLMAYHSQLIYQGFRSCISQIISFTKDHLSKKQDEAIFKEILSQDLAWINEQMKKLFLDKYFYPYGKGYGVKLYRIEDQNQYHVQIIDGIMNDHQKTERQRETKMMEDTLFPPMKMNAKFSHEDLEKSFSFSLSKLEYLRKDSKEIHNPQKQFQVQPHNNTLPNIRLSFNKKSSDTFNQQKVDNITSLGKICFQQQVAEDF